MNANLPKAFLSGYVVEKTGAISLQLPQLFLSSKDSILSFLQNSGVEGKAGEHRIISNETGTLGLVAVGKTSPIISQEDSIRRAVSVGINALRQLGAKEIHLDSMGNAKAAAEGAFLTGFAFKRFKNNGNSKKEELSFFLADSQNAPAEQKAAWEQGKVFGEAQNLAKTLADTPSNHMTPRLFCEEAVKLLSGHSNVEVYVRDKEWALKERMNSFLAVSQGSQEPPAFLEIKITGTQDVNPILLVGKGVTFDSGGISIKPSKGMGAMKGDMGGAAAILAALTGIARLGLLQKPKISIVALVPLCENMPSGTAIKPGDVVQARNGKFIEIDNTDAEGRLILADALTFGQQKYAPETIVDVATLTGAIDVALGPLTAGSFCTSDKLFEEMSYAGYSSGESIWRMPLWDEYASLIESSVADVKNCGERGGGACTAAIFLKQFLEFDPVKASPVPNWMHLDIAGVMDQGPGAPGYIAKGMRGFGTRLLMEYLKKRLQ